MTINEVLACAEMYLRKPHNECVRSYHYNVAEMEQADDLSKLVRRRGLRFIIKEFFEGIYLTYAIDSSKLSNRFKESVITRYIKEMFI